MLLRRHFVRISVGTRVLGRVLRRGGVIDGAYKALRREKKRENASFSWREA